MSMQGSLKKKSKLRYLRYLIYLSPILAVIIGYAAVSAITNESLPFTIVTGTSMQPTILAGSVAVIDKVPFDQLRIGDVIVFVPLLAENNACDSGPTPSLTSEAAVPCYVIHRIVSIRNVNGQSILTTKGDNNQGSIPFIDEGINSTMYVGKVVFEIPVAGYVTESPYNYFVALLILILLVVEFLWEKNAPNASKEAARRTVSKSLWQADFSSYYLLNARSRQNALRFFLPLHIVSNLELKFFFRISEGDRMVPLIAS